MNHQFSGQSSTHYLLTPFTTIKYLQHNPTPKMTKRKPTCYASQAQLQRDSTSSTTLTTPTDHKSPESNCICRHCAVESGDTQQGTLYPQLPRPVDPYTSPTGKLEPETTFLRAFCHDLTRSRPLSILFMSFIVLPWAVPVWKTVVSPCVLHILPNTFMGCPTSSRLCAISPHLHPYSSTRYVGCGSI